MKCKICQSDKIVLKEKFKPYIDVNFEFDIYDCLNCKSRFAIDVELDENKKELHSNNQSPYVEHYKKAEEIKELMENDLLQCERKLIVNDLLMKKVFKYIEKFNNKNISILEIGCSTGYITAFLQKKGYINSFGIDISSEPIEYAKQTFGNFYGLKEEEKEYDIIFFTGVIGCVAEPIEFIKHYMSYLSDNGVMLFNAPNVDSVKELDEIWVSSPPPDVIILFEKDSFNFVLKEFFDVKYFTTFTPVNILLKYLNKLQKKKNNIYPRKFYSENVMKKIKKSKYKQLFKKIILFLIIILVKGKILRNYSDEYGLIYEVKKIKK